MRTKGQLLTADDLRAAALQSKAWPYEEARKLIKRWPDGKPGGEPVLFETGYGPSGLPHIGTFNEVLRTTMVRHAYEELTGAPTQLIAFSDDMDGLRKVPDNVPAPQKRKLPLLAQCNRRSFDRFFPGMTGPAGIEPATSGFGDRRSTN